MLVIQELQNHFERLPMNGMINFKNMKKLFTILLLIILLVFTSSCVSSQRIIGDEYVVTSVKIWNYQTYETQYYIEAVPVNKNANAFTIDGNKMTYYTNTFYSVGDTIKLYNSSKRW